MQTYFASLLLLSLTLHALQPPDLKGMAKKRYGDAALTKVVAWEQVISINQTTPVRQKLVAANDFFNKQVRWVDDQTAHGQEDYWASPLETMGKGIGDCEDFSIAKYATLVLMGVKPSSLRMVYVKAKYSGLTQAHMVLAWYETPTSTPLILDNINFEVLSAKDRGDLFPVFSFNGESLWVSGKKSPTAANPLDRLSRWRQVLVRMRREGFVHGI